MGLMSQRAYARHRGVTHRAVQKALASGRITATPDGRIDSALADALWDANTRPSVNASQRGIADYAEARALREHYRAELARLEYEQRSGKLVDASAVQAAAFGEARRARDLLLTMPDRVAPIIVGLDDAAEVHRIIAAEVERALHELSGSRAERYAAESEGESG